MSDTRLLASVRLDKNFSVVHSAVHWMAELEASINATIGCQWF